MKKRKVLLDTNMLSSAYGRNETQVDLQRRERVLELASNSEEIELWITPLIYYETLRGAKSLAEATEIEAGLVGYKPLEIKGIHGHRAAEAYRFAVQKEGKLPDYLNKRRFDLFHCVCEEINGMELISDDKDIPKLRQLLTDSKQAKNA